METRSRVIFGSCTDMHEIPDESVHLMVTSPPYYNAPFDYPGLFENYDEFLRMIDAFAKELYRVMAPGRVAALVTDDMLVEGEKYPIVVDITTLMLKNGFRYRDKIVWEKPEGYIRISRRSGVALQHPYPMYFYPDNIQESILLFQKGKFDYNSIRKMSSETVQASKLDLDRFQKEKWHLTIWKIVNVLPTKGRIEEGVAAFPEEIPRRLIQLFTFLGETVLDPFLGSGTTMKVSRELGRSCWGYEIDLELKPIVMKKMRYGPAANNDAQLEVVERSDAKRLRTFFRIKMESQRSRAKHHNPRSHQTKKP